MNIKTSAIEYLDNINNGNITIEEYTIKILEHIQKVDKDLNSYINLNKKIIEHAQKLDKKIKSHDKIGKLIGLPISIKDNICIQNIPTTCASKLLQNFILPYNATVISKLQNEDAIFTGKTNMDEFAMGSTTEFSAYGPSKNPWNTNYVPGGSSGGSAVSVSASECICSLGSDTGGSIRNPSSFCSVVGLKPTYGLVSRFGLISYANSLEQIGPITKTVKDNALLLNIITGLDPYDNTTINSKKINYLNDIDLGIKNKNIGIISEMLGSGTDDKIITSTYDAISKFEELGAKCTMISLPSIIYSVAAYYIITSTEASSNLARFDNIRYGEIENDIHKYDFNTYISKIRKNFGEEVIRRMIIGGFVPSAGYAGKYFFKALKVKNKLTKEINIALKKFDVLLSPTVPILPFKLGEKIHDPLSMFLLDLHTSPANLTGKPAISIPFDIINGLPVGMQLISQSLHEKSLFQFAQSLESIINLPSISL